MDQTKLKELITQVIREMASSSEQPAPGGDAAKAPAQTSASVAMNETGPIQRGTDPKEVVIAVSPAFSSGINETIIGIPHSEVLKAIAAGIEEEGLTHRFAKVHRTADVGFIAHEAAKLSGSGVGIGIQSRGTSVIHQKDLAPLSNLELFPQAPLIDVDVYRAMGKNAALYAKGESPSPVPTLNDQMARPKYQAKAALLHNKETKLVDNKKKTQAVQVTYL